MYVTSETTSIKCVKCGIAYIAILNLFEFQLLIENY